MRMASRGRPWSTGERIQGLGNIMGSRAKSMLRQAVAASLLAALVGGAAVGGASDAPAVAAPSGGVLIAAGGDFSVRLSGQGLEAWGDNRVGQLGNGGTAASLRPTAVTTTGVLAGKSITALTSGSTFTLALDSTGKVFSWGENGFGQLGNGGDWDYDTGGDLMGPFKKTPSAVLTGGALAGRTVAKIAAGFSHALALDTAGRIYSWGYNYSGALGDGTTEQRWEPVNVSASGALAGKTIVAIAGGSSHSLAVDSAGKVYAWGRNRSGELGNGSGGGWDDRSPVPAAVDASGALAGKTITAVSAGCDFSLALDSAGKVYAWGTQERGRLGDGVSGNWSKYSTVPVAVGATGALAGRTVVAISAGCAHALALDDAGRVYAWGGDYAPIRLLGHATAQFSAIPVPVDVSGLLAGKTIVAISAGGAHSLAVDDAGASYAWGWNDSGQAGDGTRKTARVPVAVGKSAIALSRPSISGTARVGETLTASVAAPVPAEAVLAYRWMRNGTTIKNATASGYTITASDKAKKISVAVTATHPERSTTSKTSAQTAKVAAGVLTVGTASLSGDQLVGARLSVDPGSWTPGTKLSYQWYLDGARVPKATKSSWTVPAKAAGKRVSVKLSGAKKGYASAARLLRGSVTVAGGVSALLTDFSIVGTPSIVGVVQTGKKLTAKPGLWAPKPTLRYQWFRDGQPIVGATKSTYTIPSNGRGAVFAVETTGSRKGHVSQWRTSAPTLAALGTLTAPKPKVTGTAKQGKTLTAKPGTWTSGTTLTYQWYRASSASGTATPIPDAVAAKYVLTSQDKGRFILVKVTGTLAGYAPATKTTRVATRIG